MVVGHCSHCYVGQQKDCATMRCASAIDVAWLDLKLHDCMLVVELFEYYSRFVGVDVVFVNFFEGHDLRF